jgi:hypothetical protein
MLLYFRREFQLDFDDLADKMKASKITEQKEPSSIDEIEHSISRMSLKKNNRYSPYALPTKIYERAQRLAK